MRKSTINLVAMVVTIFGFAQNSQTNFESKFKALGTLGSNYEYRNIVQNGFTPNQAKYLENVVASWDVTKSKNFDGREGEAYTMNFKVKNGYIRATYDSKGEIVSALERFRNFALPKSVGIAIAKKYPKWTVVKNRFSIRYIKGVRLTKIFKVQITKDNQKKWLRIDPSEIIS